MEKRYKSEIKAFGKRLKSIRQKKGLTQLDPELELGINRTGISRIENGSKDIEFYTIVEFAEALDAKLSDFLAPLISAFIVKF